MKGKGGKSQVPLSMWERFMSNFRTITGAVAVALFIRIVLFEAFEIEGPSMQPTLLNGDRVVVAKFLYGLFLPFTHEALVTWGMPNLGDVVIVNSPADGIDIVKRVIGLPGDTIEIRDDVVIRNGTPLVRRNLGPCRDAQARREIDTGDCEWFEDIVGERTFRTSHAIHGGVSNFPPRQVPDDHIYIMGDHRDRSNDSRFFGPVPISRVKGRALFIYWSSDPGSDPEYHGERGTRTDRFLDGVQ